jgi:crotonobetainyl-CoA:carnitine CoA-transferase CaiB-like acyl-CoA transferase
MSVAPNQADVARPETTGPLHGVRVIELASEISSWAGKVLSDLGADVIVIESPGGAPQRRVGPFLDDIAGPERSLSWWYYNTGKRSVVLDLATPDGAAGLKRLVASADVLMNAGSMNVAGFRTDKALITVTIDHPVPLTDLTLLAAGGPVWMSGYDDHSLPPIRGGGNQGFHIAAHWAVIGLLVALMHRAHTGEGQHVDVSALAAVNVTNEVGTYGYLTMGLEVWRQTGRHASVVSSMPTQIRCADGRYVNAGILVRRGPEFAQMLRWLESLGLRDEFEGAVFLEMGTEYAAITSTDLLDPVVQQIMATVRDAQQFVASRVDAYEFFVSAQRHGLAAGVIYSPDEVLDDPHFIAREWPTTVYHDDLDRSFTYPGVQIRFTGTPAAVGARAPHIGEHQWLAG